MSEQDKDKPEKWSVVKPVIERQLWRNVLEQRYAEIQHARFDTEALKQELTEYLFDNIRWRRGLKALPADLIEELNETIADFFIEKNL